MKKILFILMMCLPVCMQAAYKWYTHFSYTNVQQIAVSDKEVYAVANGALFSVNKQTEKMTTYNPQTGMHDSRVACMQYDTLHDQLLIVYQNGKMDVLKNQHFYYVPDLYIKQLAAHKKCANITIHGKIAYLSMPFGIVTFDLGNCTLPDTYYIGPEASEVSVEDVLVKNDSIFAKSGNKVYGAALSANLVDYRVWKTITYSVTFDTQKGKVITDAQGDVWKAAGAKGIYRKQKTGEEQYYIVDGPVSNIPYHLTAANGELWMVQGGRWATQYSLPGHVMHYAKGHWTNIMSDSISQKTGINALDMTNVAVDPNDKERFFVSSYGTGVYEFYADTLVRHYWHNNSIVQSVVPAYPHRYTRTDGVTFDDQNRAWVQVASSVDTTLVAIMPDGSQRGLNMYPDGIVPYRIETPGELVIDAKNSQIKWMIGCRFKIAIIQLNDGGTTFDPSDDQFTERTELVDQDGNVISLNALYTIIQAPNGDIWVGGSEGPICIPHTTDFSTSPMCQRLRIVDGEKYLMQDEPIKAFAFDKNNRVWIGTQNVGVYVLDEDAKEVVAHYTNSNSVMPSNSVLSLAYDAQKDLMYIGTGEGLVSCSMDEDTSTNVFVDKSEENLQYGSMLRWKTHFSYSGVSEVQPLDNCIFAVSDGALFAVNRDDESIVCYSQEDGMNGTNVEHIRYNATTHRLLLTYQNGQLDVVAGRNIYGIPDLMLKTISGSKQVNSICMHGKKAYMGMQFGIIVVDMQRLEIEDTYYIGKEASEVNVQYLTVMGDTLYAVSPNTLYYAPLSANLVDYSQWKSKSLPASGTVGGLAVRNHTLCLLKGNTLWTPQGESWVKHSNPVSITKLCSTGTALYALTADNGYWEVNDQWQLVRCSTYGQVNDIYGDGAELWLGTSDHGLVRQRSTNYQVFVPDGPLHNVSFKVQAIGNRLYMLAGGRWASQYGREGSVMYYEKEQWHAISHETLVRQSVNWVSDFMQVAQDPKDAQHIYVAAYGNGVYELQDTTIVQQYLPTNSSLQSAVPTSPTIYTRTDCAVFDAQGNMWVLNAGVDMGVHVRTTDGQWYGHTIISNGSVLPLHTPGDLLIDRKDGSKKWITLCRSNTGLVLYHDGGTPSSHGDDKMYYRNVWIDQNGKQVLPTNIFCLAQDKDNTLWVGTEAGLFTLPESIDFATSNACKRIIIPRNDGTGLGDYLLGTERINAIAVDGANRKWIGTEESGVFLMSADGLETIAHFTIENSLLPSNTVLSMAIMEESGEVFVGTSAGLVSYKGDASQPYESYSSLYAFPNPVRPNYYGVITIRGLMDHSEVRITDGAGNLVRMLQGNGGEVIWDGTNTTGKRVASGVYTAAANTKDGSGHGIVKILIMN